MTRVSAMAAAAVLMTSLAACGLAAWGTASADETVSTAAPTDAHPPAQAAAPAPLNAAGGRSGNDGSVRMTACGPEGVDSAGVAETRPHGEVSVGVGTHGYREVSGSVCQPLPNGGFVAVSGGQSQIRYGH